MQLNNSCAKISSIVYRGLGEKNLRKPEIQYYSTAFGSR